ncbi:MAG: beta-ketoacyl synthase [Isosphaeraceae bacterium]
MARSLASDGAIPRVWITGLGLVTSLGSDRESSWRALREGRQGCRWLDPTDPPADPPFAGYPSVRASLRPTRLLRIAAREAVLDATLPGRYEPTRAASALGMSKGDLSLLSRSHRQLLRGGPSAMTGRWLDGWPGSAADRIVQRWDLRGPRIAPVAACATGLIAAIQAADLIRRGVCDLALAGAGDASLEPLVLGAFRRMGVLARAAQGEDPSRAVRPWDVNRSGFLVGEGSAVLVLEREDHARNRGVLPYCEFAGGAFGADAHHLAELNPDPSSLAGVIGRALTWSRVDADQIDHVNVHATATRSNDPLECSALRRALGRRALAVSCSANKAQIGHCLGAAGALELGFTALAIRDQFTPPTLNLDRPDTDCDLDGTPGVGRPRAIRAALKLSLGFGGHLAAAILKRHDGPSRPTVPFP